MSESIIETTNGEMITVTVEQATAITEAIRSATQGLYLLIQRAHNHKVYTLLGYSTWEEYVNKEFDISRGRSYQLLNQAKVIAEISEAADMEVYLTEREARSLTQALPEITEKIKDAVENCDTDSKKLIIDDTIKEELKRRGDAEALQDDIGDEEEDNAVYSGKKERKEYSDSSNSSNSGYSKSEISFFVESLERTLPIFTALPEPQMLVSEIQSKQNSDDLVASVRAVAKWFAQLANSFE